MKKKILLALMLVLVLVCIFAISVSAAEIPEWTEITEVDGMADKSVFGADGTKGATSRVLMSDGKTYPAYYICKNSTSLGFDYKELSTNSGTTYTAASVVRIEVPNGTVSSPMSAFKTENGYTALKTASFPEGFTTLGGYTFKATASVPSALVSVSLPSTLTTMGQAEFIDCALLEELIIPEGVTTIPKEFAKNTASLKKVVLPSTITTIGETAFRSSNLSEGLVIPEGCVTIKGYAFAGCMMPSVVVPCSATTIGSYAFAYCNSLTDIYCNTANIVDHMFYDCDEITNVVLKNTVIIGDHAFNNPSGGILKIENIVFPEGITKIGNYAFARMQVTSLVLPSTLSSMGNNVFDGCKKLTKAVVLGSTLGANSFNSCSALKTLVITDNFESFGSNSMGARTVLTTYYTGTDYATIKGLANVQSCIKNASTCSYEDYKNGNYTEKDLMFIYDINLCVAAFDGVHTEPQDDGDCTTAVLCAYCKEHTFKEALSHIVSERLTYASLLENGEYYHGCTNDGCTNGVITVVAPLFECLGYSMPESSVGSVAIGFKANATEIDEYERVNKTTVSYGLFAVSQQRLGENQIFDGNGKAADGVINVDTSRHAFNWFELKIVGFNEENKDNKLALGAYMLAKNEDGIKCFYMQEGTPTDGMSYFFDSYSGIVASIKK